MRIVLPAGNSVNQTLNLPGSVYELTGTLVNFRHPEVAVLIDFPFEAIDPFGEIASAPNLLQVVQSPVSAAIVCKLMHRAVHL